MRSRIAKSIQIGRLGVKVHPLRDFRLWPKVWKHVRVASWMGLLWWW